MCRCFWQKASGGTQGPVKKRESPLGIVKGVDVLSAGSLGAWGGRSGRTPRNPHRKQLPQCLLLPGAYSHLSSKDSGRWHQLKSWDSGRNTANTRDTAQTRKEEKEGEGSQALLSLPPHCSSATSQLAGPGKGNRPTLFALAQRPRGCKVQIQRVKQKPGLHNIFFKKKEDRKELRREFQRSRLPKGECTQEQESTSTPIKRITEPIY